MVVLSGCVVSPTWGESASRRDPIDFFGTTTHAKAIMKNDFFRWLLLPLAIISAGCLTNGSPDEATSANAHALTGELTWQAPAYNGCSQQERDAIAQALPRARAIANSRAFAQCVDDKIRTVYIACPEDPFANSPIDEVVRRVLDAARSRNALDIHCDDDSAIMTAAAYTSGANIGPYVRSTPESFTFTGWLPRILSEYNPWFPFPSEQIGKVIWHEAMHNHGYRHPETNSSVCGSGNIPGYILGISSIPDIVHECIFQLSFPIGPCFTLESCGVGAYRQSADYLDAANTSCTCTRDVGAATVNVPTHDILTADPAGIWRVAQSTTTGFTTPTIWLSNWATGAGFTVFAGNVDADRDDDIVVRDTAGNWYVARATNSTFAPSPSAWLTGWGAGSGTFALLMDVNGDGKSDLVSKDSAGVWYVAINTGAAFVPQPSPWLTWAAGSGYLFYAYDVDADGRSDLLARNGGVGNWYLARNLNPGFGAPELVVSGFAAGAQSIVLGDFNGDQLPDIGAKDANGNWNVVRFYGGVFEAPTRWLSGWAAGSSWVIRSGDYDADGRTDVLAGDPAKGNWFVALSNGRTFVPEPRAWLSGFTFTGSFIALSAEPAPSPSSGYREARGDRMRPGEMLHAGNSLRSADGRFTFTYQTDGNVVLYKNVNGTPRAEWWTSTNGTTNGQLFMPWTGELTLENNIGALTWRTGAADPSLSGAFLVVQNDGNVVIYKPDGGVVWHTHTFEMPLDRQWDGNALSHHTGGPDYSTTSWRAIPGYHASGLMIYGPGVTDIPVGNRTATFTIGYDKGSYTGTAVVARLDVYSTDTGQVLAQRDLRISDLTGQIGATSISLPFYNAVYGKRLEFRVNWFKKIDFTVSSVRVAGDTALRNLNLHWSSGVQDNYDTAQSASPAGYNFVRVDGHLMWSALGFTAIAKTYYNPVRGDYALVATEQGIADCLSSGYTFVRDEGFVYTYQAPGTVPLKLFWSPARGDNFTTATSVGAAEALGAGYTFIRNEGYVFP